MIQDIEERLMALKDEGYRELQLKIIPTLDPGRVIGVRTPELRKLANSLAGEKDIDIFLNSLPHPYFEEDQLHAFIIAGMKDYDLFIKRLEDFLPFVDNWATCDQMNPKLFKGHIDELEVRIDKWIASDRPYTVRFGIKMLMDHFLSEDSFKLSCAQKVCDIRSDEYYVNMMRAWYFATALAFQYDAILPFIEEKRLDDQTHNKAIQKAVESFRISDEQKVYLRRLRVKR